MPIRLSLLVLLGLLVPASAFAAEAKEKGTFVAIETLTASVMGGGRREVLTVQAGVDCPTPALHDYAEKVTPRLRDAYTQVLQLYAGGLVSGAPPDPDYVGRRMQEATDRVLGKPGGKFLIGGIMVN
ncbi:MAG TPA: hypothetical protein VGM25_00470 [Caulobacteraceae bacterium]|jgi:hypothetical protein